jgi:hypothetical protein
MLVHVILSVQHETRTFYPYEDLVSCHDNPNLFSTFQIYSEMIGNVMTDARSTGKYYHCKFLYQFFTQ